MKDGEIGQGEWSHSRWCKTHNQYHGPLYPCESYSKEALVEIRQASHEFKKNIVNDESFEGGIMRMFMGINKGDSIE